MEKEYEAKSLLSHSDFNLMKEKLIKENKTMSEQLENYYLDTQDAFFKNNNSALRLRKSNTYIEVTIKQKTNDGSFEYNNPITENTLHDILNTKSIDLKNYDCPYDMHLSNLTIDKMITKRLTIINDDVTICLDECIYSNNKDFEIEIEANSILQAERFLKEIINKYNIKYEKSYPKIKRLKDYKKNEK